MIRALLIAWASLILLACGGTTDNPPTTTSPPTIAPTTSSTATVYPTSTSYPIQPTLTPDPTPTMYPTSTPRPSLPTLTPEPTFTPAPKPTATHVPTPTLSPEAATSAEEKRQEAGTLWLGVSQQCTAPEFSGHRRQSDYQTLVDAEEVNDQMLAEMASLPDLEAMTPEERLQAADMFETAAMELFEICFPPGWDEHWQPSR